jgi:GAF domain-containing protein
MSPDELLRQLGELATSLGPAVRPAGTDELLRSLTETARRLFGAAACSLALLTEDESELVYTVAAGQGADDVTGMRIPASHGIAGWVVQSGQPIAISDVAADPRFSREQAEQTGYIPQAILAVPVETPERLLGVISLLDRDPRRPGAEQDMALLSLFADQAALALASVERFSLMGRVLLDALAQAAASTDPARAVANDDTANDDTANDDAASDGLAGTLRRAADHLPAADADLAELAATFAALARRGAAERRLALAVLRDIADYTERRPPRPR